jgi:hypothetical protein
MEKTFKSYVNPTMSSKDRSQKMISTQIENLEKIKSRIDKKIHELKKKLKENSSKKEDIETDKTLGELGLGK